MNEAKFSANWKMYAPPGAQMQFTVRADDPVEHLALLEGYFQALAQRGFTVTEPGLDDGQKQEEVNAYVVGETSKGDACVYLYSSKTALAWRIATVYVEKFSELPFPVRGKKWEASAAPERAEAEKKGYLNTIAPFKIVLEGVPDPDSGKTRWRFLRVAPGAAALPPADADTEFAALPSANVPANAPKPASAPGPKVSPGAKQKLAHIKTAQFFDQARPFAEQYPHWQNENGDADGAHICASACKLGFTEITNDNLAEVFRKLTEYALSKSADAA